MIMCIALKERCMHEMKIGIIGAGRVGCSLGKYLADKGRTVAGFYSRNFESAALAAEFTSTDDFPVMAFDEMEKLVALSDTLIITTPDDEISGVWDCMKEMSVDERIICHVSGSLSSDVFVGIEKKRAYGASIHPLLAFRDRFSSYMQLNNGFFTLEGDGTALWGLEKLLQELGNPYRVIERKDKAAYHCAASILSNHVLALLELGFGLLETCGFSEEEAREASASLIRGNIENVLKNGTLSSMTGPVLRGDLSTVEKHFQVLEGEDREIYRLLGRRLLKMAKTKDPGKDYEKLERLFCTSENAAHGDRIKK